MSQLHHLGIDLVLFLAKSDEIIDPVLQLLFELRKLDFWPLE